MFSSSAPCLHRHRSPSHYYLHWYYCCCCCSGYIQFGYVSIYIVDFGTKFSPGSPTNSVTVPVPRARAPTHSVAGESVAPARTLAFARKERVACVCIVIYHFFVVRCATTTRSIDLLRLCARRENIINIVRYEICECICFWSRFDDK